MSCFLLALRLALPVSVPAAAVGFLLQNSSSDTPALQASHSRVKALQHCFGWFSHPESGLDREEKGSDESTTQVLQISSTDTPALHASHRALMALQQYWGSGNPMDLAEAVEAITTRRSIKVDAINPVNFMVCLYLLCFDEVLLLLLLLSCVCVFTSLLLMFVSCVGRRGADDSPM